MMSIERNHSFVCVNLFPMEVTGIFLSHCSCCRRLERSFKTLKLWLCSACRRLACDQRPSADSCLVRSGRPVPGQSRASSWSAAQRWRRAPSRRRPSPRPCFPGCPRSDCSLIRTGKEGRRTPGRMLLSAVSRPDSLGKKYFDVRQVGRGPAPVAGGAIQGEPGAPVRLCFSARLCTP